MRNRLVLMATFIAAALVSLPGHAEWQYDDDDDDGIVRCESRDGRTQHCSTYGGSAQLVRQLSDTRCVRGHNWGSDSRGIWVSGGCRAEFRVGNGGYGDYDDDDYYNIGYGDNGVFRCESRDGEHRTCRTYGGYVELIRQLSRTPCIRGRNWGTDSRGVWVSDGCRAEFRSGDRYGYGNGHGNGYGYGGGVVRCESRDNRSRECAIAAGRRDQIRLVRQMSSTPCIEGQTWGRTNRGIWVTRGCRAEFVVSRRMTGRDQQYTPQPFTPVPTDAGSYTDASGGPIRPSQVVERPHNSGPRSDGSDERRRRCERPVEPALRADGPQGQEQRQPPPPSSPQPDASGGPVQPVEQRVEQRRSAEGGDERRRGADTP